MHGSWSSSSSVDIGACCSWRPSDRRLALEQEAIEIAALAHVVVRIGLVHDAAVVPHHPVARTPLVAIFVFFLRGVPHQLVAGLPRFLVLHSTDCFHVL